MRPTHKACLLGLTLLITPRAMANPVFIDVTIPLATASITAIAAEIVVAGLILGALALPRRFRFLFAAAGMHIITYPTFIVASICLRNLELSEEASISIGELLIVAIEAFAYYIYTQKTQMNTSIKRCVTASIAGNLTSLTLGFAIFMGMIQFGLYTK